jgi:hypothetical protein
MKQCGAAAVITLNMVKLHSLLAKAPQHAGSCPGSVMSFKIVIPSLVDEGAAIIRDHLNC